MASVFDDNDIEDLGGEIRIRLPIRTNDSIVCKNLSVDDKILNGKTTFNEIEFGNTLVSNRATTKNIFLTSDEREKINVENITKEGEMTPLSFLTNIRPKVFKFKKETPVGSNHFGFIAQDIEKRFPQMISVVNGKKHVNYIECIPLILEKINNLEKKLTEMKSRNKK